MRKTNKPFEEVRHAVETQTGCPIDEAGLDALWVAWAGNPAREDRILKGWAEHGPMVLKLVAEYPWETHAGQVSAGQMTGFYIFARDRSRDLRMKAFKAEMEKGYAARSAARKAIQRDLGDLALDHLEKADLHFWKAERIQDEPTPLC